MRIAYFTDSLSPLARVLETLPREGVELRLFAAQRPGHAWRDRVHQVRSIPLVSSASYRFGLPLPRGIDAGLRAFQPDVVHVLGSTPLGWYGVERARRLGIPVVGSFHADWVSYLRFYGLGRWERQGWRYVRWFYNRCDATFAPSISMAERLREQGVQRVDVWERGIDHHHFSPALRSEALRERARALDRPLLLYVGRLARQKNLQDLAEAVTLLRDWFGPDAFRVAIVGDGPYREDLRRQLPEAHYAGYQKDGALARWYASADLLVFPSTTETFGNVVLEAFASGVPVVGANACGTKDLVEHGVNGLLARPNDPSHLARQIALLLDHPARLARMGDAAEQTALRYRWADVNRRLLDSYRHLIARTAAAA
jgi:glycosyltransferase involved in cell wall biosynthesis